MVWDGKYDEYGNNRPVDIAGSAMPNAKRSRLLDMPKEHSASRWPDQPCELKTTQQDDFQGICTGSRF
jgi:adenine-specific DNA-methyltransferase